MDGDALDFDLLLAAARHKISELRDDPRLSESLPGSRGSALRGHVLDLIGAVDHRMAQQPSTGASQRARSSFARNMRQGIAMLGGAHAALPWLDATRRPNVNMGSLYVTEEWAQLLIGPDIDLVVVPDPEFMYSTVNSPFAAVINKTPGFVPATVQRPVVLNYPLSDADRLLLHPIFAHELGHASVKTHGLVAAVATELDNRPVFTTALQDAVNNMAASTGLTQTQVSGLLRGWLHDWIEELLCDHLAIEAAGPAFMWAFALFVMPQGYGEPGQEHPPNTLRMKLALSHLARRGWRPYMERVAPGLTAWLDGIASDATGHLEGHFAFLRDQLTTHATIIQDTAMGRTGGAALEPGPSEPDADEAADLLQRLILPVGLGDPLEARTILLGGWQQAIQKHGDKPAGLVAAVADRRLQELVGKAIEMSTVASAWEAA